MVLIAEFKIEGIEETANAFGVLPEMFFKVIDREMRKGIAEITNTAKDKCPEKTGDLRRSIESRKGDEPLEYLCGTDVKYAIYVEYGTSPHLIVPKTKKVLKFKIGKEEIFSRYVHHPGTSPQPFLEPALFEHEDEINKNVEEAMKNEIKRLRGETD